jgi:hypothetical protein
MGWEKSVAVWPLNVRGLEGPSVGMFNPAACVDPVAISSDRTLARVDRVAVAIPLLVSRFIM